MKKPVLIRVLLAGLVVGPVLSIVPVWLGSGRVAAGLPVLGRVGEFALTEANQRAVRSEDLRGKVWIASFILTRCAGACPIMTHHLARLQSRLPVRDDLRLVSVTVDPEHDTPAALAEYATKNKADRTRWLFLTGSRPEIQRLARGAFSLVVDETAGTEEEPVLHSTKFVLVDRQAQIRGYYDGLDTAGLDALVRDVRRVLAEKS